MNREIKQQIAEILAQLARLNDGRLSPQIILSEAENSASPLHDQFEWDDTVAAHAHRLEQARTIIRSVTIVTHTEHKAVSTVCYVRDPTLEHRTQGYLSMERVRSDADLAREVIVQEFARAAAALRRAREIAAALEMETEVTDLVERLGVLQNRAAEQPSAG